ncbi:Protein fam86a [Irineochytrium annulatum]|nr:Protein fam86a [Irineochytrium annulatum]
MVPLRSFNWSSLPPAADWSPTFQSELIAQTVFHPVNIRAPVAQQYTSHFLKHVILELERIRAECSDDLLDLYIKTISPSYSGEAKCYRSYAIPLVSGAEWVSIREETMTISRGTTGLRTWPAALYLIEYLSAYPTYVRDQRILELGAGMGLVGLVCAKLGARSIALTDSDAGVVEVLKENLTFNTVDGSVFLLNWEEPLVGCEELDDCDVIIGSDVAYDPLIVRPLIETIAAIFERGKPRKTAYIAATVRSESTHALLLTTLDTKRDIFNYEVLLWRRSNVFYYDEFGEIVLVRLESRHPHEQVPK